MASKLVTKSSHAEGRTFISFNSDGTRCFTGGSDCIVRIWKLGGEHDQEPEVAADAEAGITCIAASDDYWISGSEDTEVRRYAPNKPDILGLVTTTNGVPVRSVDIDSRGVHVAVASDEMEVKVVNVENGEQVKILQGHKAGVRKVTWHPSEPLLTTSSSDGTIIVWDLSDDAPRIEKTIDGVIPKVTDDKDSEFGHDCSVVWHPSGEHFYVATRTHDVAVYKRSDWSRMKTLSSKEMTGSITALALSPNGQYIFAATQSRVYVFSTGAFTFLAKQSGTPGAVINQLVFSPRENLLAWTDESGSLSRWHNPISSDLPDPHKIVKAGTAKSITEATESEVADLFDAPPNDDLDPKDDDAYDLDDNFVIDDLDDGGYRDDANEKNVDGPVKEMVSITKAQPPFQPGSTPMENNKGYLAYNTIGVIEVTDQETHQLITVDFFDRSARSGYNFTDHSKYHLGCLGERGALFACPPEDQHPAHVLYKPYGSRDADWTYTLRERTRVLGIAAGGLPPARSLRNNTNASEEMQGYGNIVIATSENDLTFLSGTGLERRVVGLGGDFVTMIAGTEWVFVVYRSGSTTIDGSQNLHYFLINFDDFSVRQRDVVPIPKGKLLKWVGISAEGAPVIYDTSGRLHILTKFRIPHHASWTRLLDAELLERKKGKDESYWPVGVTENVFMCLILKGRQEHPRFPRPLIQELPIQMPFRKGEVAEERIQRGSMYLDLAMDALDDELTTLEIVEKERAMDKEFITLMQGACRSSNVARALELAKLLHYPQALDTAMRLADFYHLSGLKDQIGVLKAVMEQSEDLHVLAREKRRRWNKVQAPPRRIEMEDQRVSRPAPFQDFEPPPPISRPGLERATPAVGTTRFSSVVPESDSSSWDATPSETSPPGKRKRDETEDSSQTDPASTPTFPALKQQKVNPFARKPQENGRNPFARKSDVNKIVQKSDSFFDKVDAAETGTLKSKRLKGKDKEKEKRDGPKQTTLFGLPPGAGDKKPKATKKKTSPLAESSTVDQLMEDANSGVEDSTGETQIETQVDETPGDDYVETQLVDSQLVDSQISNEDMDT